MDESALPEDGDRNLSLAAALRDRNAALERAHRELDALRGELAVRDGYLADLRARLVEAEERVNREAREGATARERLAAIATSVYVRASVDEETIRQRVAAAILRVSELKDRERVHALRALRQLRRR